MLSTFQYNDTPYSTQSHWFLSHLGDPSLKPVLSTLIRSASLPPSLRTHPHGKLRRIPRLHEDRPGAGELADQAFTTADAGDDSSTGHTLHHILAIPGNQMAVVEDVLLTLDELGQTHVSNDLKCLLSEERGTMGRGEKDEERTHILPYNRPETP